MRLGASASPADPDRPADGRAHGRRGSASGRGSNRASRGGSRPATDGDAGGAPCLAAPSGDRVVLDADHLAAVAAPGRPCNSARMARPSSFRPPKNCAQPAIDGSRDRRRSGHKVRRRRWRWLPSERKSGLAAFDCGGRGYSSPRPSLVAVRIGRSSCRRRIGGCLSAAAAHPLSTLSMVLPKRGRANRRR